jgi:hypothetical protein
MSLVGPDSRTSAAAGLPLYPERPFRTHQMNRRVRDAGGDGQGAALRPCLDPRMRRTGQSARGRADSQHRCDALVFAGMEHILVVVETAPQVRDLA